MARKTGTGGSVAPDVSGDLEELVVVRNLEGGGSDVLKRRRIWLMSLR